MFTTLSLRPTIRHLGTQYKDTLKFTQHEEIFVAHIAFSLVLAVCIKQALNIIANGDHKHYDNYKITKEFKIIAGLVILFSLVNLGLAIANEAMKDDITDFTNVIPEEYIEDKKSHDFWNPTTTQRHVIRTTEKPVNAQLYPTLVLVFDVLGIFLAIVGFGLIVALTKREHNVYDRLRRSSKSKRSRSHTSVRSRSASRYTIEEV